MINEWRHLKEFYDAAEAEDKACLLYTSPLSWNSLRSGKQRHSVITRGGGVSSHRPCVASGPFLTRSSLSRKKGKRREGHRFAQTQPRIPPALQQGEVGGLALSGSLLPEEPAGEEPAGTHGGDQGGQGGDPQPDPPPYPGGLPAPDVYKRQTGVVHIKDADHVPEGDHDRLSQVQIQTSSLLQDPGRPAAVSYTHLWRIS